MLHKIKLAFLAVGLMAIAPCFAAKKESDAQAFWPFRMSHRAFEGLKGGFFSGAAGYVWSRMAFGANRTLPGTALRVGAGAVTGFFGNWAQAKRVYEEKKQKKQLAASPVEHVGNVVGGAYFGGVAGNVGMRYALHTYKVPVANHWLRFGALAGAGLGVLWNAAKVVNS